MQAWTFLKSTNGAGMNDPSRNTATRAKVNSTLRRRSGVRKIRATALSTGFLRFRSVGPENGHPWCRRRGGSADRTARGDDLLLRRGGHLVHGDVQTNRDLAGPEDLDLLVLPHGALRHEVGDGDVAARRVEVGQLLEVDDLVLHPERVGEAAQLGRAHHEVQVAALEAGAHAVAGLRALGAAAGGLALRALTASDTGAVLLGAGGRTEVVHLQQGDLLLRRSGRGGLLRLGGGALRGLCHQSISSTFTRWATART